MLVGIHAVNINTGGALVLLCELLEKIEPFCIRIDVYVHVNFDTERINFKSDKINYLHKKNLFSSLFFSNIYDRSLFFGNLPPLNQVKKSTTYIHNSYLVSNIENRNLSLPLKVKFLLLKTYIKVFSKKTEYFVCQTESMKNKFQLFYNKKISISPFYRELKKYPSEIKYDLCFIGLPSFHKKYNFLLDCLDIISKKGIQLSIFVTVPFECNFQGILKRIDSINQAKNIRIINRGLASSEAISDVYNSSRALIFPSSTESFGLPLIEASLLGMNVFAPNLTYVNDVISDFIDIKLDDTNYTVNKIIEFMQDPTKFPKAQLKAKNNFPKQFLAGKGYEQ
ncbi:glycosyltransferase [Providencia alcalifaciens]|uniref:Glycosyl transferase group 1 n=2 Tax=Providencia TaxID=586 RepID=A0A346CLC0_9GAMM|nr:glycosyltransferase [Providencia alcalifaciens]AXL96394.1 glycosyl transferase group 1 [Providencia alcalifaciens]MTC52612.1 glycosyltransferase [Providencia alcalifaciens]